MPQGPPRRRRRPAREEVDLAERIEALRQEMFAAAENLEFEKAARLRDQLRLLKGDADMAGLARADQAAKARGGAKRACARRRQGGPLSLTRLRRVAHERLTALGGVADRLHCVAAGRGRERCAALRLASLTVCARSRYRSSWLNVILGAGPRCARAHPL